MLTDPQFITVAEAAGLLRVSKMTVYRLVVRHDALLLFRMEVKDRPFPRRRSGGVKLEAA